MSKKYCIIIDPKLSSVEILHEELGGAATLEYTLAYSTRDLEDGSMLLNFIWDWSTFGIDPEDEDEFELERDIVKNLLNSLFPIDTRKEYWFIPSSYDDKTKRYSEFIYHSSICKDENMAKAWIKGNVSSLDEYSQKFRVKDIVHIIPPEWELSDRQVVTCIKWIERHYNGVLLYGASVMSLSLSPALFKVIDSLHRSFENEETKSDAIDICLKLFALKFLLLLNRPKYSNYKLANNLPRALSNLNSNFCGYSLRNAIFNGSSVKDLIPYVNQVIKEIANQ